ncbi:MAG TPA: nucleoside phosphorylase, partial [Acidimicrobiales bacterium]|nr:nucleoside phosphorylase [Acidimicrobiales bacterium]
DKHALEAVVSPRQVIDVYLADPALVVPDAVVLTYQRHLLDELAGRGVKPVGAPWPRQSFWFSGEKAKVAVVGGCGLGAPAAAIVLEELAALGVRQFISIGAAGCLQPDCHFGETVVCTSAIRDEGVSHHCAASEKFSCPSQTLTRRLTQSLAEQGAGQPRCGPTWTIDAPYRETIAEAQSYRAEGVVCVDMEAAALFTVGAFRHVDVAAAFVVSDHLLAEEHWTHAFGSQTLHDGLVRLLDAALQTLDAGALRRRVAVAPALSGWQTIGRGPEGLSEVLLDRSS